METSACFCAVKVNRKKFSKLSLSLARFAYFIALSLIAPSPVVVYSRFSECEMGERFLRRGARRLAISREK